MPSEHLWAQNPATGPAMTHSVTGSWCARPRAKDTSQGKVKATDTVKHSQHQICLKQRLMSLI